MRRVKDTDFVLLLDAHSGLPFYKQIILQIKMAMAAGRLQCGDKLPSVRELAVSLGINPNTVTRAYNQLEQTGYVSTQQGTGTFIASKAVKLPELEREKILAELTKKFIAKASSYGFDVQEILKYLEEMQICH